MRAVVWIAEGSWQACVDQARAILPPDTAVTLLHVAPGDVEALAEGARRGLFGRHPPPPPPHGSIREISDAEAGRLLATARERLGRECETMARRGRVEREVIAACAQADADVLVLARDGERKLGPPSLGHHPRFVVDHAPCTVVLAWAQAPPAVETIPPPPRHRP
ncbi:MAG: universal stress protein [Solirubrobacterales bacterium]|nr:universal stress protein [Solirubrobacterales bacterium]